MRLPFKTIQHIYIQSFRTRCFETIISVKLLFNFDVQYNNHLTRALHFPLCSGVVNAVHIVTVPYNNI